MDEEITTSKAKLSVEEVALSMQRFGWPDYGVFLFMLIMCTWIGAYWGFMRKQNAQDYLMGGRNMKIFPVSVSLVASFISGISLLGTPTEVYVYGMQYMYIAWGVIMMALILTYIYLPVYHELKLTSSYEYLERRFDKTIRLFGSILFTISLITWLPIVIYVPALAFNQVTGINVHIITPIVCIICIFYTCVGGLQAVVWTDVIQTFVMVGAIFIVAVKGTADIGGISVVWQRNIESERLEPPNWDPNPYVRHTVWSLGFGGCFYWLVSNAVSQSMVQRYLSLPSLAAAQKAAWCFVVGVLGVIGMCCYCGLLIYATYHDCDPLTTKLAKAKDQLLPLYVMDVLGEFHGMPGLFVAGVFSAALSSLSTGLNSMAAVVLEDFYKPFSKKDLTEYQMSILMKAVVIILGIICVCLVFVVEKMGAVLQLTLSLGAITSGASLGIFSVGLLIPKVHARGALVGGIVGLMALTWICIRAQTAIAIGDLTFPMKTVSTDGCHYTFTPTVTPLHNTTTTEESQTEGLFMLYRLSYLWYTLLGSSITMLVALLVSLVWQPVDTKNINPKLLAPFLRKYYTNYEEKPKQQGEELKNGANRPTTNEIEIPQNEF